VAVDGTPARVDNIQDALENRKRCMCEDDGGGVIDNTVIPYNAGQAGPQGEKESLVDRESSGRLCVRVVDY